ncbi:MAG: hypothetical protein R3F14_34060 [Polyangiaceae bacterium]
MKSPDLPLDAAGPVEPPSRPTAKSGREILERVMRELSRLPARVDRGPVLASLGGALASLIALDRSDLDASDHIEILRAAVTASARAHAEMSKAEGTSGAGLAASIEAVHAALSAKVDPTLDAIVQRQDRRLRDALPRASSPDAAPPAPSSTGTHPRRAPGEARDPRTPGESRDPRGAATTAKKPEQLGFMTSAGVPRLFSFERAPVPPLLRVAPPASAVREAEAREAQVSSELTTASLTDTLAQDTGEAPPGSLEPIDEASSLEREVEEAEKTGRADNASRADDPEEASGSRSAAGDEDRTGPVFSAEEAERAALRRIARDVAEELGSLGLLRTPVGPYSAWFAGPQSFEDRLLAHLDAFIALAEPYISVDRERRFDVLTPLLDWAGDSMVPDPVRAFARAFVLGSISGEDTAAAAITSLRQSHPITHDAQRDALALAPHPGVTPLLERMIPEETPTLAVVGLSVLERRGQVAFEAVTPLLSHPASAVRTAAARALRAASAREIAKHLLAQHAATEEDEGVLAATAESLVVLGSRRGLDIARAELAEEARFPGALSRAARASHLRLLSLAGGPSDGMLLLASLGHDPIAATGLGFFGDATLIPAMLAALSESAGMAARSLFCSALARSLQRITGFCRPPEGDPQTSIHLVDPSLDPGFWARTWEEKKEAFAPRKRYRLGGLFSPLQAIAEAETPELPASRRGDLLLELSILSRGASRARGGLGVTAGLALAELRAHERGGRRGLSRGQWAATALFEP